MRVAFLGFNSFLTHKRGVENVIFFQSKTSTLKNSYYIHLGNETNIYRYDNLICFSIKHNILWPFFLNMLLHKLKKERKVVLHSHNPLLSFFFLGKIDILTVHDGLYYQCKELKKRFLWFFAFVEYVVYKKTTIVHFISFFTKNNSLCPKNKRSVIIYNTSHLEMRKDIEEQIVHDPLIRNILSVRSIEERARFDLLLEVAEKIENSSIQFNIVGKGPLLTHFKEECSKRNILNVNFLGYTSDGELNELYKTSDLILVIAEYGEGFGLPIIEGYLYNKPVIASNRCAIPEVIISNKFLFENDANSITERIHYSKTFHRINYRAFYDSKFSNKTIEFELIELYKLFV